MKELLSFEFRKLWRSKSLWICTIVMIVLNIASVVITYSTQRMINNLAGTESIFDLGGTVLASSGLKSLITSASGTNYTILFAIFVTIFICADFSEGTIKNILSRGFSREQVFFAKSITIVTGGLVFSIISIAVNFLAATIAFGAGKGYSGTVVVILLVQMLALSAYIMLDVLLAVLFTKAGGAMTLGIIIPMVVPLLGQLLDLALSSIFDSIEFGDSVVTNYLIGTNLSTVSKIDVAGKDLLFGGIIFGVYIILFALLGLLSIRKKEV